MGPEQIFKPGHKRLSSSRSQSSLRAAATPVKRLNVGTNIRNSPRPPTASSSQGEETNISVYVRCRSRNEREIGENSGVVVSTLGHNGKEVIVQANQNNSLNKTYTFDKVFGAESDQETVFEDVAKGALAEMLQGYNCTIFAYGQTGTGKTYSMSGDITSSANGVLGPHAGIIPRILVQLFKDVGTSTVRVSFIELYNEELKDLLASDRSDSKVRIYDDHDKRSIVVQGMQEVFIHDASEGLKYLAEGSYKRQVAATQCNDLSSRSHTVFTITVHTKKTDPISGEEYVKVGKLNLVDLAGSENISRSGAENRRAREAGVINQSLLTLGRVINSLVDKSSHIPYRESKLTRLLQDSLGGQTKTCIIATISPAKVSIEETLSTLEYASRAKNIKNKPQVNQTMSKQMLISEYIEEIETLRKDLEATREQTGGVYMTNENHQKLVQESESRRILIDEQKARIGLLEDQNSRYKETHEQHLLETKALKSEVQAAEKEIRQVTHQLAMMEEKAVEFENKYQEEVLLTRELQNAEMNSQRLYQSLLDIVEEMKSGRSELKALLVKSNRLFQENTDILDAKKRDISIAIEQSAMQSIDFLKTQNEQFVEQFGVKFTEIITRQRESFGRKISEFAHVGSDLSHWTSEIAGVIHESAQKMQYLMEQCFEEQISSQTVRIEKCFNSLQEALSAEGDQHIQAVFDTETTVQDSYHTIGASLQKSFELIELQIDAQLQELQRLTGVFQEQHKANTKLLEAQISSSAVAYEAESKREDAERAELVGQISALIEESATKSRRRQEQLFHSNHGFLIKTRDRDVDFTGQYQNWMSNLVESDHTFAKALENHKEGLRHKLVQHHELNKNKILALNDITKEQAKVRKSTLNRITQDTVKMQGNVHTVKEELSLRYRDSANTLEQRLQEMKQSTQKSLNKISADFTTIKDEMEQIKPSLVDTYVNGQKVLLASHEKVITGNGYQLAELVSSVGLKSQNLEVPPLKDYSYPSELPRSRSKEELTKNRKPKIAVAADNSMANDSMALHEAEILTPLPVPIPDKPLVENTPSSMGKVKNFKQRQGTQRHDKSKILQQLNI